MKNRLKVAVVMSLYLGTFMAMFSVFFAWLTKKSFFEFYFGETKVIYSLLLMIGAVFCLAFVFSSSDPDAD